LISNNQLKQIKTIWGKSNRDNTHEIHLLILHMLESGAVAKKLWEQALSKGVKEDISKLFNDLDVQAAGNILSYWTALHDIGKASPVFQIKLKNKNNAFIQKISTTGLPFGKFLDSHVYHNLVSSHFLNKNRYVPKEIATAISGHHGQWGAFHNLQSAALGTEEWEQLRLNLVRTVKGIMGIKETPEITFKDQEKANLFTVWFSGFICICDWLASNKEYFEYKDDFSSLDTYYQEALIKSEKILEKIGWVGWRASENPISFMDMYRFKDWGGPRPEQTATIQAYEEFSPDEPFLMIIEAPTGIGKTEAAFYIADRWNQETGGNGMYIAMPTQATSNQIFKRSKDILEHRYPTELINIALAHGKAAWNKDLASIRVEEIGEKIPEQSVIASAWFQDNRKRTLLTSFGVGTVDQVFLSILQTKHFFVRLFGLKNKTVIFDEVHAYDTYMNVLFERLLEWLRRLGASVIVLSATLPEKVRKNITAAYCGLDNTDIPTDQHYPRLTLASQNHKPLVTPLPRSDEDRDITIRWESEANLVKLLTEKLSGGGCAAVICNTVNHAQEIYKELKLANIVPNDDLILFHARFPFIWRQYIEERVIARFGKDERNIENPMRPYKAVVVSTQVIEQSLDLDFDLMVTEIAPIDLILQRIGRLHRHARAQRPIKTPTLYISHPEIDENGFPDFGTSRFIYPESKLLRTFFALKNKKDIHVIKETRTLISQIYNDDKAINTFEKNLEHITTIEKKEKEEYLKKKNSARSCMIRNAHDERLLTFENINLQETDNPNIDPHYRALTRDFGMSISIICLYRGENGKIYLEPECNGEVVNIQKIKDDPEMIRCVLMRSVNINSPWIVSNLLNDSNLITVRNVSALRYHRLMIFEGSEYQSVNYQFTINRETGLHWRKNGKI